MDFENSIKIFTWTMALLWYQGLSLSPSVLSSSGSCARTMNDLGSMMLSSVRRLPLLPATAQDTRAPTYFLHVESSHKIAVFLEDWFPMFRLLQLLFVWGSATWAGPAFCTGTLNALMHYGFCHHDAWIQTSGITPPVLHSSSMPTLPVLLHSQRIVMMHECSPGGVNSPGLHPCIIMVKGTAH